MDAVIDLARRCLLPADATEAESIVPVLSRTGHLFTRHVGGELVGAALASPGRKDAAGAHLDLLLVHPEHRRRGIATDLLAEVEQWARDNAFGAIKVMGNPPDYAWPGVDVRYTAAVCALTAAGFKRTRTAWNMTAPLPPPPAGQAPDGVVIRRAVKEDLESLLPVVSAEWGPAWAGEVERALTGGGGVHIAVREGEPIAFAAWGACRPSWFGPMGTLPSATGLGLGGILLRECLADQAALGLTEAQIGWVGPVRFYSNAADALIERVFFLFDKPL